jgi:hypothetical protein
LYIPPVKQDLVIDRQYIVAYNPIGYGEIYLLFNSRR